MPGLKELFDVRLVDAGLFALALAVGGVGATDVRPLIEPDADPFEGLYKLRFARRIVSRAIGVFDSKDVDPALVPSVKELEEGIAERSHVEQSGWTRRESDTNGHSR